MDKGFGEARLSTKNNRKHSSLLLASDCEKIQKQLTYHFEELADPRGSQGILHPFISIVMIALLATIGGAKGWEDIDYFWVKSKSSLKLMRLLLFQLY
jgi:hypothetical protein